MKYKIEKVRKYFILKDEFNNKYKILKKIFNQFNTGYNKNLNEIEIDEDFLEMILKESQIYDAYDKSVKLIYRRRKTVFQVKNYLIIKGFDNEIIEETIEKLKREGFVDDLDFVEDFIRYQKDEKLLSRNNIKRKLYLKLGKDLEKNIGDFNVNGLLEKIYPSDDEVEIGLKLLEKHKYLQKLRDLKSKEKKVFNENSNKNNDEMKEIILNIKKFLASKGFSFNNINKILNLLKI